MEKLATIKKLMVKIAAGLAIFTPIFFTLSALGSKAGLWDWKFGFGVLVRNYGPKLMLLTLAAALLRCWLLFCL